MTQRKRDPIVECDSCGATADVVVLARDGAGVATRVHEPAGWGDLVFRRDRSNIVHKNDLCPRCAQSVEVLLTSDYSWPPMTASDRDIG